MVENGLNAVGVLKWFVAWFVIFFVAIFALLYYLAWDAGHWSFSDLPGATKTTSGQEVRRHSVPSIRTKKVPRKAKKSPSEPATVKEARKWASCHGAACYYDIRQEVKRDLPNAL